MKMFVFLAGLAVASAQDLGTIRTVYLLPMSGGLDQYLAVQLTTTHMFQVVTDPQKADAILTDHIGDTFEAKMAELFPPPDEQPAPKPKPKDTDEDSDATNKLITDTVNKLATPNSSFGHAKGIIFLVDPKSKQVLWSSYDLPKDSTATELDRTAADIVNRIKRELTPKKK